MKLRTFVIAGLMALGLSGGPFAWGAGTVITLTKALELARHGPAVAEAAAAIDQAAAAGRQVGSARRPTLELGANDRFLASDPGYVIPRGALGNPIALGLIGGERHVWTASMTVHQLLWDAGRTKNLLESAGLAEEAARAREISVRRAIELATVRAYATACITGDLIQVSKKAVAEYRALLAQVTNLVNGEQLPLADQLQARAAFEAAKVDLIDAEAHHTKAMAALEELTGVTAAVVAPMPPLRKSTMATRADAWIARALRRRRELEALERQQASLRARAEAARAGTHPVLVAVAGVRRMDDAYQLHKNNASIALAVKIPLVDGGLAGSRAAQLDAQARAAAARLELVRRQIRREVRDAVAGVIASRQRLLAARAGRAAAGESLRMARLRYREHLITNRELLDAEADAVGARRSVVVAKTQLAEAVLVLENVTGGNLAGSFDTAHMNMEGTNNGR